MCDLLGKVLLLSKQWKELRRPKSLKNGACYLLGLGVFPSYYRRKGKRKQGLIHDEKGATRLAIASRGTVHSCKVAIPLVYAPPFI